MSSRRCLAYLLLPALILPAAAQRRGGIFGGNTGGRHVHLQVRVVFHNDRLVDDPQLHVQVVNSSGVVVGDSYPKGAAASFPDLDPGTYRLRVSGAGIEDTEQLVDTSNSDGYYITDVVVKARSDAGPLSTEGTISARSLNVPGKARKELQKGTASLQQQDPAAAEKYFRKAIDIYPQFAEAYNDLGVACLRQKNYGCARGSWVKALGLDPALAQADVNLSRLRLMEGDVSAADLLLLHAVTVEPMNGEALLLLAAVELQLGKFEPAVAYARKIPREFTRGTAMAHLIAGRGLEELHKFKEAAAEFTAALQSAVPQDPVSRRAQAALARLQPAMAKP